MDLDSLNFAYTAWEVASSALILVGGFLAAFLQYRLFKIPTKLALFLYFWHSVACFSYFYYSQISSADSTYYYLGLFNAEKGFALGTNAVLVITALIKDVFLLSYGGTFLFYNLIGFIGLIAFYAAIREVTKNADEVIKRYAFFSVLLPGASFWSSAIGKDAIAFFAIGLICWGGLRLKYRFFSLVLGVVAMVLVRPHIAAVLILIFILALVLSDTLNSLNRITISCISIPVAFIVVEYTLRNLGIQGIAEIGSLTEYIAQKIERNSEGGLAFDLSEIPFLLRPLNYLFRPLFFDVPFDDAIRALFGLVLSFENFLVLIIFLGAILSKFNGKVTTLPSFTWWMYLGFSLACIAVLANSTSNFGMAVRHKWMILPMLLIFCFSYIGSAYSNKRVI